MQIAREQWNLTPAEVGSALKAQGINEFDPGKWLEMKQIVLDFAMAKQTANSPLVKTNAETTQIAKSFRDPYAPLIVAALNGQGLNEEPLPLLCGPKPTWHSSLT